MFVNHIKVSTTTVKIRVGFQSLRYLELLFMPDCMHFSSHSLDNNCGCIKKNTTNKTKHNLNVIVLVCITFCQIPELVWCARWVPTSI